MSTQTKFVLTEKHLPEAWYNINPDMPVNPAETAWNAVLHDSDTSVLEDLPKLRGEFLVPIQHEEAPAGQEAKPAGRSR